MNVHMITIHLSSNCKLHKCLLVQERINAFGLFIVKTNGKFQQQYGYI